MHRPRSDMIYFAAHTLRHDHGTFSFGIPRTQTVNDVTGQVRLLCSSQLALYHISDCQYMDRAWYAEQALPLAHLINAGRSLRIKRRARAQSVIGNAWKTAAAGTRLAVFPLQAAIRALRRSRSSALIRIFASATRFFPQKPARYRLKQTI